MALHLVDLFPDPKQDKRRNKPLGKKNPNRKNMGKPEKCNEEVSITKQTTEKTLVQLLEDPDVGPRPRNIQQVRKQHNRKPKLDGKLPETIKVFKPNLVGKSHDELKEMVMEITRLKKIPDNKLQISFDEGLRSIRRMKKEFVKKEKEEAKQRKEKENSLQSK